MSCYKRPESVLVVIATRDNDVLLLERCEPQGFWQSVTGALEWGELPYAAALREVLEETGLDVSDTLTDCNQRNRFAILPAWRARYAPEVMTNLEHVFRVILPQRLPITLSAEEHRQCVWLPAKKAHQKASSATNQAAIDRYLVR